MDLAQLEQTIDLMRRKGVRSLRADGIAIDLGPDPADVAITTETDTDPDIAARRARAERERYEAILFRSAQ